MNDNFRINGEAAKQKEGKMNTTMMTSNSTAFTEIAESRPETTETETEHPETYLYDVGNNFFMIVDPIILIVGLVGNSLSFMVMQVGISY